ESKSRMPLSQIKFEHAPSYEDALHKAAVEWGVEREFWDIFGNYHVAPADTGREFLGRWASTSRRGIPWRKRGCVDSSSEPRFCRTRPLSRKTTRQWIFHCPPR